MQCIQVSHCHDCSSSSIGANTQDSPLKDRCSQFSVCHNHCHLFAAGSLDQCIKGNNVSEIVVFFACSCHTMITKIQFGVCRRALVYEISTIRKIPHSTCVADIAILNFCHPPPVQCACTIIMLPGPVTFAGGRPN